MRVSRFVRAVCVLATATMLATAHAQSVGSAFTYQGELRAAGAAANAAYDLQFRLFNSASGANQVGPTLTLAGVSVINGVFSAPLDFGPAQFAGDAQWLEISVRPATGGAFETLVPRTAVTPTPYALGAVAALANSVTSTSIVDGTIQFSDVLAMQFQARVTGNCPSGQYVRVVNQDGTVTCGTDASGTGTVTSVTTGTGLTGGPITATGTISVAAGGIGTTEINAAQVQRRVMGNCPSGQYVRVVNQDGTVTCGTDASGTAGWGLSGNAGTNPATNFIGTTDAQPFVVRTRNAPSLRIEPSTILFNGVPITTNTIAGSSANAVTAGVRGATIAGGGMPSGESDPDFGVGSAPNQVTDIYGTVGGGYGNRAGNDGTGVSSEFSATVGGGALNTASGAASTIGGGQRNVASGVRSTVGGGEVNTASGEISTVSGGIFNVVSGPESTVGGGGDNTASGFRSTIGGGQGNTASGTRSTVSGGQGNTASGTSSTVSGGQVNTASGETSTVSGGIFNCAGGAFSWAGGALAKVRPGANSGAPGQGCLGVPGSGNTDGDSGTFVWADSQGASLVSTGPNQFLIRAQGGIWVGTNASPSIPAGRFINTSTGAHLTTGGTWTNASSRALKTAFEAVDMAEVLARVLTLPLSRWQYRDSPAEGVHLGPVAEDFHAAFGLGADGRAISTVDADGIALAAIQGLNAKLETENSALRADLAALREEVRALAAMRAR